jgi:hypothetical protein
MERGRRDRTAVAADGGAGAQTAMAVAAGLHGFLAVGVEG